MKYDFIIANPPYGKIGNEITQCIVDNLEWGVYVNLMPANDYRRFNKDNKLYQHVDLENMFPIKNGFRDAEVVTHMALIKKRPSMFLSEEEFEIENYFDEDLKKYFYKNRFMDNGEKRYHYALDNGISEITIEKAKTISPDTDFLMGVRDMAKSNMPFTRTGIAYVWNVKKNINNDYIIKKYKHNLTGKEARTLHLSHIHFNTKAEHDNFTNFIFDNPEFADMLSKALHADGYVDLGKIYPKVDWSKPHTVEDILKGYDYSDKEIEKIQERIKNYPKHKPVDE